MTLIHHHSPVKAFTPHLVCSLVFALVLWAAKASRSSHDSERNLADLHCVGQEARHQPQQTQQAGLWGPQSTVHLIGLQESQQQAEASRHRLQTPLLCPSHKLQTAWQVFQELLFHLWWELTSHHIPASRNWQNCPLTTLASPSWQTTQWQVFQTGYFFHKIIYFFILVAQSLFSINFKYYFLNSTLFSKKIYFGEISEILGGSPRESLGNPQDPWIWLPVTWLNRVGCYGPRCCY